MNKETGGPAFPTNYFYDQDTEHEVLPMQGMTLRDYFAAKAMNGLLAGSLKSSETMLIARDCYAMADAMIKAREA